MAASTRSRAITRSWRGPEELISATAVVSCSRDSVGKFADVIANSEKLTSRSATATLVAASIRTVPSAGAVSAAPVYDTAEYITIDFWSSQLTTCGSYTTIRPPEGEVYDRGHPPSTGCAAARAGAGAAIVAAGETSNVRESTQERHLRIM